MRCAFCMTMDETSKKEGVCAFCLPYTEGKSPHRTMSSKKWGGLQPMFAKRGQKALQKLMDDGHIDELLGKMKDEA